MSLFYKIEKPQPEHPTVEHKATALTKAVSMLCTATMLNVLLLPAAAAAENNRTQAQIAQNQPVAGDNAYEQLVNLSAQHQLQTQNYQNQRKSYLAGRSIYLKVVDGITSLFTDDNEDVNLYNSDTIRSTSSKLSKISEQLATDQQTMLAELTQQKQRLLQTGNAKAATEQDKLISDMQTRYQTLQKLVQAVNTAQGEHQQYEALTALNKQLDAWQPKKPQTDMKNLPWGMPDNKVRQPIVSKEDANGFKPASFHPNTSLTTPHSAIHQWRNTEYRIGQYLLHKVGNNPLAMNISTSGMTEAGQWTVLNALPAQTQDADLSETDDVQITDAIKAKAKELGNNPAAIYKWVHDNIEYVPTYGSIQGSDYTLQTMRGNDTDTASLLIALLRASGIPARYVYGTVDIPAKQAMDWVGGVNNIDAAQNLLGQGGVPSTALMNGSEPKYLRLEHTWVEANVSNLPAKGSMPNTADSSNTWIPLDASYKSYVRTAGIDIAKAVPFDAQKLIDQAKTGATIDEATGSVQNLNQDAVNTAITDYQKQVEAYLQQNHPNATVGDVLGTSKIKEYKSQFLSPVLPYQVKTVISDYQALPDNMKHYFQMQLFESTDNGLLYGGGYYEDVTSPIATVKIPTTKLQGKPLALSFKPASQTDENTLLSYMPKDANGTLPTSLPTSINMMPELTLNGEVLLSKGIYKLGSDVKLKYGIQSPNSGLPSMVDKDITAGSYYAIGYNLQGMSQAELERTKKTLEDTKTKLEAFQASKDQTALAGLTKHDLTGAIMQAGVQSYFAVLQAQDVIAQKQAGIITNPYMSFGTFGTGLSTQYRYGIAMSTKPKGVIMDIDRILKQTVDKDNKAEKVTAYNRATGPSMSLNENLVPEQLFDDPKTTEKEAEGISAVKALQIASSQGQTIYTITQANYSAVLPKLNHSQDVMTDVRNAINAGKEVTISQTQVHAFGWSGTGYIVLDSESGVGGYLIGGGADGGWTQFIKDNAFIISLGLLALSFVPYVGSIANILGWVLANYLLFISFQKAIDSTCARGVSGIITAYSFIFLLNTALTFYGGGAIGAFIAFFLGDTFAEAVSGAVNNLSCREMP